MKMKNPTPIAAKPKNKALEEDVGAVEPAQPEEINGYKSLGLPEPTRYKDWEVKGRCSDF